MAQPNPVDPSAPAAHALPPRSKDAVSSARSAPVWALSSAPADDAVSTPLASKCDKHNRPQAVCCRDLKGEDERTLIDPDIIRDIIIGFSDGLVVPFGLMAGLAALGSSRLVYVGGLAELISGAISMGVGGYLSAEAERDHFRYMKRVTRDRVRRSCSGELEREVSEILQPFGIDETLTRRVANALVKVEYSVDDEQVAPKKDGFLRQCMSCIARKPRDPESARNLKFSEDVGLTPFLLKLGEGMEEVEDFRLWQSAMIIGISYFVGGLIPMVPYFFIDPALHALYISIIVTAVVLVFFGIFKTYFTGAKVGFAGYARGAGSMLFVGGVAVASAYGIVRALEG